MRGGLDLSWKPSLSAQPTPSADGADWESLGDYSVLEFESPRQDIDGIFAII